MKKQLTYELLKNYNKAFKEQDDVYHDIAKKLQISDCAFWIFYMLRFCENPITQKELCDMQSIPKQTVNSALKKLEREGYLSLDCEGNKRNKYIHLTPKGLAFARANIDSVIELEVKALAAFTESEQQDFIRLYQKYTYALQENVKNYIRKESEYL